MTQSLPHIQVTVHDTVTIKKLLDSANVYANKNFEISHKIISKALSLASDKNLIQWQAHCHKNLGVVHANAGGASNIEQSFFHASKALKIYRKHGDSLNAFRCLNNLSTAANTIRDYDQALGFALDAAHILRNLESRQEIYLEAGASSAALAFSYRMLKLYDSAISNYLQAKKYMWQHNRTAAANKKNNYEFYLALNLGQVYVAKGDYENAYDNYTEAYSGIAETGDTLALATTSNYLAALLIKTKKFSQAKEYLFQALKLSEANGFGEIEILSLYRLARVYLEIENLDSSFIFTEKALRFGQKKGFDKYKRNILLLRASIFEKGLDSLQALKQYQLTLNIEDSSENVRAKAMGLLLDNLSQEHKTEVRNLNTVLNRKDDWLFTTLGLALIMLASIFGLLFRYRATLQNFRIKQKRDQWQIEKVSKTRDHLERKMVTSSANLALKDELLKTIKTLLERIEEQNRVEIQVKDRIADTRQLINHQLKLDNIWNDFFIHFQEVHPEFLGKLKSEYQLSTTDLRLCAYLKIDFTYKEISRILNITQSSLHVTIHRLKKKLGLPKETSVLEFLQGIH